LISVIWPWVVDIEMEMVTMSSDIVPDAELDCVGLFCPMPIAKTKEEIDKIEVGQVLKVEADDPAAEEDIKRWAKRTGHEILKFEKEGTILTFFIRRMK
jgi:tRNA 2-thiouridine synthesizing protein A